MNSAASATRRSFNSRLREEATIVDVAAAREALVSTHASVRRRPVHIRAYR